MRTFLALAAAASAACVVHQRQEARGDPGPSAPSICQWDHMRCDSDVENDAGVPNPLALCSGERRTPCSDP